MRGNAPFLPTKSATRTCGGNEGNARRAKVASNCVASMATCAPWSSWYVLRGGAGGWRAAGAQPGQPLGLRYIKSGGGDADTIVLHPS